MIRSLTMAAIAALLVAPAMAQDPPKQKVTKPAKQIGQIDQAPIKEGMPIVGEAGQCTVTFNVTVEGKVKDPKPQCSSDKMNPYAIRAVEGVTYEPEVFLDEIFEAENIKLAFSWPAPRAGGAVTTAAAGGDSAPVVTTQIDPNAIKRAMERVNKPGSCQATFTVGVDGKPKDIKPNCQPGGFNNPIKSAIEDMRYTPGKKGGVAVETPGVQLPLNLGRN